MGQLAVDRQCGAREMDWVDAIARVRRGGALDGSAGETLTHGLRIILARRVRPMYRAVVIEHVLEQVVSGIREEQLSTPAEIARAARNAVEQLLGSQPELQSSSIKDAGAPAPEVLAALSSMSERHREMLHRFYVRAEDPEQICRTMRTGVEEFSRTRAELRRLGRRLSRALVSDAPSMST